jgi:hypothetical protein
MFGKRKLTDRSPQQESDSARPRIEEMEIGGMDYCEKLSGIMDDMKVKVGTTFSAMELAGEEVTTAQLGFWMQTLCGTLMGSMEQQSSIVSDMAMEMSVMREELKRKGEEVKKLKDDFRGQEVAVKAVAKAKENLEIKASSKEMEEKLRTATTQFKLMDVNIGRETDDRREIIEKGVAEIRKNLRTDAVKDFDELIKFAEVAPLTRKTFKATGKEYFSAPLLFTVQDKSKKWKLEDTLRASKMYPGFHWPQEMVAPVKEYRRILKEDGGVDEDTSYVRIRPAERDGRMRIKADVKEKTNSGRFSLKAVWDVPPICSEVRKMAKDYLKPTWASGQRG